MTKANAALVASKVSKDLKGFKDQKETKVIQVRKVKLVQQDFMLLFRESLILRQR